jgi:hypothetical protein
MGDTLRVNFDNEAVMYMEVISIVPIKVAIMIEGKDESYILSGVHNLGYSTNIMGSELDIENRSKYKVVFKDSKEDDIYEWTLPDA